MRTLVFAGKMGPAFSRNSAEIVEANVRQVMAVTRNSQREYELILENDATDNMYRFYENGCAAISGPYMNNNVFMYIMAQAFCD